MAFQMVSKSPYSFNELIDEKTILENIYDSIWKLTLTELQVVSLKFLPGQLVPPPL